MDDEALQKQSDPISLADVVWKIREAVELIEANSVVVPADQKRKAEMFSSIKMMLAYWAMCGGGTVTCDPPSDFEPDVPEDVPEDNPKALVDQTQDKVKDKGGMKRSRCNGGFPRDDDDCQPSNSGVKRKEVRKKSVVKLNRNVKPKVDDSKESPSSSSASCVEVEVVEESPVAVTISSSPGDDYASGNNDGPNDDSDSSGISAAALRRYRSAVEAENTGDADAGFKEGRAGGTDAGPKEGRSPPSSSSDNDGGK